VGEGMNIVSSLFGESVLGQKVIVYLELANGAVLSGQAVVAELTVNTSPLEYRSFGSQWSQHVGGWQDWKLTLTGDGEPTFTFEQRERIKQEVEKVEWYCLFCGAVMPKAERKCEGCGAWRSFVYDL